MSEKGKWPKRVSQSEVYMKSKMCCIYLSLPCRRSNKVRQVPLAIHFEIGYFGYGEGKVWKQILEKENRMEKRVVTHHI